MSISVQTRKILWGLSGNRCAFPDCNQELHVESGNNGTVIGEECHIEAQSIGGPRYNAQLSNKQIDDYYNLILLCPIHHKIIDDNPELYTVAELHKIKSRHEAYVRKALDSNSKKENDILYYEAVVSYVSQMMDFDGWECWTSFMLSADGPMCTKIMRDSFDNAIRYIKNRIWLEQYPQLEEAIQEFGSILEDCINLFDQHAECWNGCYKTEKFYKIRPYDAVLARRLLEEYRHHVLLVDNLIFELTRSANRICDLTRRFLDDSYRLFEGKLMADNRCPEYRKNEKYPGINGFEKLIETRDVFFKIQK